MLQNDLQQAHTWCHRHGLYAELLDFAIPHYDEIEAFFDSTHARLVSRVMNSTVLETTRFLLLEVITQGFSRHT